MSLPRMLGRYEVVSRLATGGMAEIILARVRGPAGFHRPIVLKRVLPHLAEDDAFRSMFIDEARIIAGLTHTNVVQVHELFQENGELFLVLEYLAGESVSGLMRGLAQAGRPVPLALAAHVVAEACAGLHAAHELRDENGEPRCVVHRDVSPQNLFVTYDGDVKVLDFGVAKARMRLTRTHTGHAKGKFGYMSPEQCRREEVDRRTDVFALGIVLHELVTGRRLFPEGSELAIVRAICDDPVPLPSSLRPECPESLDRICARALAKEPLDRYDSAEAMRLDLVRALRALAPDSSPRDDLAAMMRALFDGRIAEKQAMLQAVPTTVTAAGAPTRTRNWWIAAIAAVALIGGAVAATIMSGDAPQEPPRAPAPQVSRAPSPPVVAEEPVEASARPAPTTASEAEIETTAERPQRRRRSPRTAVVETAPPESTTSDEPAAVEPQRPFYLFD